MCKDFYWLFLKPHLALSSHLQCPGSGIPWAGKRERSWLGETRSGREYEATPPAQRQLLLQDFTIRIFLSQKHWLVRRPVRGRGSGFWCRLSRSVALGRCGWLRRCGWLGRGGWLWWGGRLWRGGKIRRGLGTRPRLGSRPWSRPWLRPG